MNTVAALAAIIARHSLSILGLAFVDVHALRIALFAIILGLDIHLYQALCSWHHEDILGYVLGCAICALTIFTLYFLVLTPNPRKTFRLRNAAGPQTASQKLLWSIRVHSSTRLIGFENQAAKIPRAPSISRRSFVVQRLRHVILGSIVAGVAGLPVVWFDLVDFIHPAEGRLPNLKQEIFRRLCAAVLCLYIALWSINTPYELVSILCVGTGLTESNEWPPLFGPILEGTTLAKCWRSVNQQSRSTLIIALIHSAVLCSQVWHQTFRCVCVDLTCLLIR